jgi:hypothetical protein
VAIFILKNSHSFYASRPALNQALNSAYSHYKASGTHNALKKHFPLAQEYSISQITEFILKDHI